MRAWLLAGLLLCLPLAARAQRDVIQVQHAWSRPAMAGHNGVVYLSITDHGPADRLVAASSPAAAKAELHETTNDHGVMKMRPVAALPVPSGKTVTLRPGGYHIMLVDLKHALAAGDSVPVRLTFAHAGSVDVMAMVERSGAMGGMKMQ